MNKDRTALVIDAFQISLSSGTLQATEAALNGAKLAAKDLPESRERQEICEWIDACWRNCMLLFSVGQEHGRSGALSPTLEQVADVNDEHARAGLQHALQIAQKLIAKEQAKPAATRVEQLLLGCGTLIGKLFAAGRIDGEQLKKGVHAPMNSGHKSC